MPLADTLNRKPGDVLKSDDWNVIIKEIDRVVKNLDSVVKKAGDTMTGALTIIKRSDVSGFAASFESENDEPPYINWYHNRNGKETRLRYGYIQAGNDGIKEFRFVAENGANFKFSGGNLTVSGNVGVGTNNPVAKLDIASADRTGTHPTAVKGLYITGDFNSDNDGVEFRHSSGTQGIGFGFNTIYAAGSNANQDLQLKPKGTGEVKVAGNLSVSSSVKAQALTVSGSLSVTGSVSFGSQVRQMLNLWSTNYGIGVQTSTQYFRSDANFAWYRGGSHNDAELNAGGGTSLMTLDRNGNLSVSGNLSVTNVLEIGDTPFGGNTGGNRDWMQKGIKINWDSDSLFIGLKNEGANRKDSVIGWGDDADDAFRFIYLGAGAPDKEIMRLNPNGNVGIGTSTPNDKLDVAGSLRILTGSNPIRFTSVWSAFPDAVTNQAEISNDTGAFKTLMIVGNRSAGLDRRVSIWDRLEVNGQLEVKGNGNTFRISVEEKRVVFYLSNAYHGTDKRISWDGDNNWDQVS